MYLEVFKKKIDYISSGANKLKDNLLDPNEVKVETEIGVLFNYLSIYSKVWNAALFSNSRAGYVHFKRTISQLGHPPKSRVFEQILKLVTEKLNLDELDEYTAVYSLPRLRLIENRKKHDYIISLFIILIYYLLDKQLTKLERLTTKGIRSLINEDFESSDFKKVINLAYLSEFLHSYVEDLVNRIVDESEEFTGIEYNLFKIYAVSLGIITIVNELDENDLSLEFDRFVQNLFNKVEGKNWNLLRYVGSNFHLRINQIFKLENLRYYPELDRIVNKILDKEVSVDTALLFYFLLNENFGAELIKEETFNQLTTTKEFSTYFLKINLEQLFLNTLEELKIHLQNNSTPSSVQVFTQSNINTTLRTLISTTISPVIEKVVKTLLINTKINIDTAIEREIKDLSFSISMYFQSFVANVPTTSNFETLVKELYTKVFNFSETLLYSMSDKPVLENLIKEKMPTLKKRLGESKFNLIVSLIKELLIETLVFTESTFYSHNIYTTYIKDNLEFLLGKISKVVEFSVLNLGIFNSFFERNNVLVKERNSVNKLTSTLSDSIAYYINYLESNLPQAKEIITNAYFIDSIISLYNFYPKVVLYLTGQEYSFALEKFYNLNLEKSLTKNLKLFSKGSSRSITLKNVTEINLKNGLIETLGGEHLIKTNFSIPFLGAEIESLVNVVSGFTVPDFEDSSLIDFQVEFEKEEIKRLEEIYLNLSDVSLEDYLKLFDKNFLSEEPYGIDFLDHLYFNTLNSNQFKIKILRLVEPIDVLSLSFLYDLDSKNYNSSSVSLRFDLKNNKLKNKDDINIYGIDVGVLSSTIYNFDTLYELRTRLKNYIYTEYKIRDWSINSVIKSLLNTNPNFGAGKIINIPNQKYLIPRYKIPF